MFTRTFVRSFICGNNISHLENLYLICVHKHAQVHMMIVFNHFYFVAPKMVESWVSSSLTDFHTSIYHIIHLISSVENFISLRLLSLSFSWIRGQIDFWWMQMIDKQLENETFFRSRKIDFRCDFASHRKCGVQPKRPLQYSLLYVTYAFSNCFTFVNFVHDTNERALWILHTTHSTHGWKASTSRRSVKCVFFLPNRNTNKTEMNKTNEWSRNHSSKSGNQKTLWI